jgi:hypothetical protein
MLLDQELQSTDIVVAISFKYYVGGVTICGEYLRAI